MALIESLNILENSYGHYITLSRSKIYDKYFPNQTLKLLPNVDNLLYYGHYGCSLPYRFFC